MHRRKFIGRFFAFCLSAGLCSPGKGQSTGNEDLGPARGRGVNSPASMEGRLGLGQGRIRSGRLMLITLDGAYDRALSSDQSIGIAYLEIQRSDLLRWRALTRYEPRVRGSLGRGRSELDRSTISRTEATDDTEGTSLTQKNSVTTKLLPKSTTEMSQFEEQKRAAERTPFDSLARDTHTSSAEVILEQPLLDLTVFAAWRFGKLSAQASRLQCRFTIREVLFGVARAYYDVLRSEAVAKIDGETVELATQQLDLAQKRFDAGDALRSDVLRARANVESARRKVVESQTGIKVTRTVLGNILNLPMGTGFRLVQPEKAALEIMTMEAAVNRAFTQREDYQVSALAVEQERERRNEVTASYAPKVTAQLRAGSVDETRRSSSSFSRSGSAFDNQASSGFTTNATFGSPPQTTPASSVSSARSTDDFFSRSSSRSSGSTNSWEALVVVELPFWGRNTIDRRNAMLQISQAVLQQEKLAKQVQQEVTDAWLKVESLQQTLKALKAEVEAAEQSYRDLKNQYEAGSATILDTLVALRELNAARALLISESYDYEVALREVQRATGDFQRQRVSSLKLR